VKHSKQSFAGAFFWLIGLTIAGASNAATNLVIGVKHPEISKHVVQIMEELHYAKPRIDNSLSSAILDRYLDSLDSNRLYFLSTEIATFGRYRYEFDERLRSGELQPVFNIFNAFSARTEERVAYAIEVLANEPDFNLDETFRFDRSELSWPVSEAELREIWRKRIKNDGLGLVLTGKTWAETVEILTERYARLAKRVTQITSDDVFETFMNAVSHTIDPHSSYFSPRNSEEYRIAMSLSYEGIGASLQLREDYVTIINIIPGGPAQVDGQLKPEDRITAVGQGTGGELVDVIGWRLDDVVDVIRGPLGTTIRLQVLPAGAAPGSPEQLISLVRDKVKLEEQAAKSQVLDIPRGDHDYKIGVISVPSFYQDHAARSQGDTEYTSTTRDVTRLISELKSTKIDGLVIDLRANGGGHLSEATELSGLFIERGPVVQLKETRGRVQPLDDPSPGEAIYSGPLAVLVDRYSASASEIFAAAIQDYERGVVVGQQTFGKGSVQNLFSLDRIMREPGNGQLTLTIGKYYRVTGDSTQYQGVKPDIQLPSSIDLDRVGESVRDTALPYDRIKPTRFRAKQSLDDEIQKLEAQHTARTITDPNLNYLISDIAAFKIIRDVETISLNLSQRTIERENLDKQQLERANLRRVALGLNPAESLEDLSSEDTPDILLEEAGRIVADMAALDAAGKLLTQLN